MKYSLSNYILSVKCNDETMSNIFGVISIGGEGSYLDTISLSLNESLFTTTSYATGGWIHDKNLSKSGTASVTLNQLSAQVAKFKQMCRLYYSGDYEGLTLILSDADGNEVATCVDCFPTKIPAQEFSEKAGSQNWSFTCGKIIFN